MKKTAGVLLYRCKKKVQVLLVNNGKRWSIPKGSIDRNESKLTTAIRELKEEARLEAPSELVEIGYVQQKGVERLYCFAGAQDKKQVPRPAHEIKMTRFFELDHAYELVPPYQKPLLEVLFFMKRTG